MEVSSFDGMSWLRQYAVLYRFAFSCMHVHNVISCANAFFFFLLRFLVFFGEETEPCLVSALAGSARMYAVAWPSETASETAQ